MNTFTKSTTQDWIFLDFGKHGTRIQHFDYIETPLCTCVFLDGVILCSKKSIFQRLEHGLPVCDGYDKSSGKEVVVSVADVVVVVVEVDFGV